MYLKLFQRLLTTLGYHGSYLTEYSNAWDTVFWKDEYKIHFNIRCKNNDLAYKDIEHDLYDIFLFVKTKEAINISKEDDIEELLMNFLTQSSLFSNAHFNKNLLYNISVCKNDIEYLISISMQTEEDHSIDKFDEDHDAVLESSRKDVLQTLIQKGVKNLEVDISHDFLTVNAFMHYNQKVHPIEIRSFYDDYFYMWSMDAICLVHCYWQVLTQNTRDFLTRLETNGFYEIISQEDINGDILIFTYRGGNKYAIKLTVEDYRTISQQNTSGDVVMCTYHGGNKYAIKPTVEDEVIQFDKMDGHAFERFCADILLKNGFEKITVTRGSGDQGIDIIAYKDDVKYGIQCKCHSADIGNKAVQEAFSGKTYYNCHLGVVLTNRNFTKSARELAARNGVILWDRKKLLKMIENAK